MSVRFDAFTDRELTTCLVSASEECSTGAATSTVANMIIDVMAVTHWKRRMLEQNSTDPEELISADKPMDMWYVKILASIW